MGLKPTFTRADIQAEFKRQQEKTNTAILRTLSYLGELCVAHARTVNTYRDQTGNLRNSVGYVISRNGILMSDNFQRTSGGGGTSGVLDGRRLALTVANGFSDGWVLVVVAGMNYATAVESRGLDVLTSAEQIAETQLPILIRQLKLDVDQSL